MNRIFSIVWNRARGVWMVVGEHAARLGKGASAGGVLFLAAAGLQPVQAQSVSGTGDVNPAVPSPPQAEWDLGTTILYVGQTSTGSLTIENGGIVSNGNAYIGDAEGAEGAVMVTGGNSEWNLRNLNVGRTGTGSLTIENGGTVSSITGAISDDGGAGAVTVTGVGSSWQAGFFLSVGNAYSTGELTIADGATVSTDEGGFGVNLAGNGYATGTVNIGAGATDAAVAPGVLDSPLLSLGLGDGTLVFNHTGTDYEFSAALESAPSGKRLVNHLAGTTRLTGDGSYFTGDTSVSGGTLIVDHTLGGSASVTGGRLVVDGKFDGGVNASTTGVLAGSGVITGAAYFSDGGVLAGSQGDTLRIEGEAQMDDSSVVNVALGGTSSDALFDVGGDLALDGTLNIADQGGFGAGVYRLFDYEGALSGDGLAIGLVPAGVSADDLGIQTSEAKQINLISSTGVTLGFWDGGDTSLHDNDAVDGGAGSWRADGRNWTAADGAMNVPFWPNPTYAVFQGAPGTVAVDDSAGKVNVTGMQFATDGYRIEGDAVGLEGPGDESIIRVGDGTLAGSDVKATIAAELTGTSALVKSDHGTLVLEGSNRYTGGTRLEGGVLSVSSDANLGHRDGALTFDGGTLAATAAFNTDRAMDLTAAGRFDVSAGTQLGLNGAVSGSGGLIKQGDGDLILSAANAYGDTRVQAGTLVGTAASISGHIANAGTVRFDQAADARFAGDIAGLGGAQGVMIKTGAGTLALEGRSTLDWTIAEGGLRTAAARFGGNAHLDGATTALTFTDTNDAVYAGVISGNGQFAVESGGTLQLTGDSSQFAGTTTLSNGTLLVGHGSGKGLLGGSLDVLGGGTLGGSGTLGAGSGSKVTIASGGTLAPGNSIGTLTIDGDLAFEPGSRFEVEVDPQSTDSDRVAVTGNATVHGGSVVHIGAAGNYVLRSTYTILSAGKTLTGEFDEVSSDFAFLTPQLQYDYGANTVDLALVRNDRDFDDDPAPDPGLNPDPDAPSSRLTRNQKATARGVQSIGLEADHAVYDAVVQLPNDEKLIRDSFDALSGEIHASAKTALIEDSRFIRNAANDRVRAAFSAPGTSSAPVAAYGRGSVSAAHGGPVVWSQAFGTWGKTDSDGNAASLDHNTGGLLIGADRLAGDWRVGVLAGYSHSDFKAHDRASSGKSDNYHLGLYGGTQWEALGLRTGLAYTWHDIDIKRSVAIPGLSSNPRASYNAGTFQAFGELGYGIELKRVRLEPFVNLAHVHLHTDAYSESGGAAALSGRSDNTDVTFSTLGLRAEHTLSAGAAEATLRAMVGWRHAFGDTTPKARHGFSAGDAFTAAGVPVAKDSAVLEAGIDLNLTPRASFGLSYAGQLSGSARDHGVKANLAIKF